MYLHFKFIFQKLENKVKAAKVNCDSYQMLCQQAGVSAYPTLLFYSPTSKSYRGTEITSQSAVKIISFVEARLTNHDTHNHDEF